MKDNKERRNTFERINPAMLCMVLAVVLAIALCIGLYWMHTKGYAGDAPETQGPTPVSPEEGEAQSAELTVSVTQQGEYMLVVTELCRLSYPSAFVDVIQVEVVNGEEGSALVFSAKLREKTLSLYTLRFYGDLGQPVGSLADAQGKPIPVRVEFFSLPESLQNDEKETFLAAQETVNDILASLAENENYSAN